MGWLTRSEPASWVVGMEDAPPPERLLLKADRIYRWRGRKMGRTIFRTRVGLLLLTDRRLVFLSSGRTDVWSRMAWASLGLGPEPIVKAATVADATRTVLGWIHGRFGTPPVGEPVRVEPAALLKDGSLNVPLGELTEFGVTQRRLSSFLWIAYRTGDAVEEFAFSNQVAIPGGVVWETTIRQARAANRAASP
jgi:hypothetical protein